MLVLQAQDASFLASLKKSAGSKQPVIEAEADAEMSNAKRGKGRPKKLEESEKKAPEIKSKEIRNRNSPVAKQGIGRPKKADPPVSAPAKMKVVRGKSRKAIQESDSEDLADAKPRRGRPNKTSPKSDAPAVKTRKGRH